MIEIPDIDDTINDDLEQYAAQLDKLMTAALNGEMRESEFEDKLTVIVMAILLLAWAKGGGDVGNPASLAALNEQREIHKKSIATLTDDIYSGRYSASEGDKPITAEEARGKLDTRLGLWIYGAARIYNRAKRHRALAGDEAEVTETWRLGATEKHCKTCFALNGVTLTSSEWQQLGIEPQSPDLECGGWKCDCSRKNEGRPSDGLGNVLGILGL